MMNEQDLQTVRDLAEVYELVESVSLEGGEIVVRGTDAGTGCSITERFATAEEACSAIASWRFVGPVTVQS